MSNKLTLTGTLITEPATLPLTIEAARKSRRALTHEEDDLIEIWIAAATTFFEGQTGRQLITATREIWLDSFPNTGSLRIVLPNPPLQNVLTVAYLQSAGTEVTLVEDTDYVVKAPSGPYAVPGWIEPVSSSWPQAMTQGASVRVQYTCGYGDRPDDVPELARGVLQFLVGHFDQHREATTDQRAAAIPLPFGVDRIMEEFSYRALRATAPRTA